MAFPWAAVIGGASSLLGSIISSSGQSSSNAANRRMVDEQRAWEEKMSNTAYQRATTDMKAAGLNPMLAYTQGGAGTPSYQLAQMKNPTESFSGVGADVNTAVNVGSQKKERDEAIATMKTQQQVNSALASKTNADAALSTSQTVSQNLKNISSAFQTKLAAYEADYRLKRHPLFKELGLDFKDTIDSVLPFANVFGHK